jgi:GT2 family glycosyltransferase
MQIYSEFPLVSIVTPSFNQGRFIRETIESVLGQDYPSIEYIVVDGGSTDGTLDILRSYEGRLTWVAGPDRGQSDAINKGLRRAQGEVLAWLNSDDTYLPGAVGKAVNYFKTHPDIGMVYGKGYHVDMHGRILDRYYTEPFDFDRLMEVCFVCQPAVFWRAEVSHETGLLDVDLHYCLDYEFWMRIAKKFKVGYLREYLANARTHAESKTQTGTVRALREIMGTVDRHYASVPLPWIRGYARACADARHPYSRGVVGIYSDGWASDHVTVLSEQLSTAVGMEISGVLDQGPATITVRRRSEVLRAERIENRGRFSLGVVLPRVPAGPEPPEVEILCDTFARGERGDTRRLAYRSVSIALTGADGRVRRLAGGRNEVLFSARAQSTFLTTWLAWRARRVFRRHGTTSTRLDRHAVA